MRTDQYAYQQATRVAGLGLILQLAATLLLLVLGRLFGSSAFGSAATVAFAGVAVWASLAVLFHQHRLAALEAAEAEELRASRSDTTVFGSERAGDALVAQKRLQKLQRYLLPVVALATAAFLAYTGVTTVSYVNALASGTDAPEVAKFSVGSATGWQLAICVSLALVAFIFSRFVAGMAKQPAWQNLRGGAGFMVATALVLVAIAVGLVANAFGKGKVLEPIVLAVGIGQVAFAAEIALNFVLGLYRPRRVGDNPRAAFDSRVLSLVAAPDSIVRSINEAVNYQFGFDITSSWGYQLLLRSTAWLLALGAGVLVLLSTVVVVPPGQQAVRLRGGAIVGEVYEGTVMLKWPWPFETALVEDVARIRTLTLGSKPMKVGRVNTWGDDEASRDADRPGYLVAAPTLPDEVKGDLRGAEGDAPSDAAAADAASKEISQRFALVDADFVLNYRVARGGLLDWLAFAPDVRVRRTPSDMRERLLRDIALREVTRYLSTQPMDSVLSPRGDSVVRTLRERVQGAFDAAKSGVELVALQVPTLRPPAGEGIGMFEEISIDVQNARKVREEADRTARATMASIAGSPERATEIVAAIADLDRVEREQGEDSQAARDRRAEVEQLIVSSKGGAARVIGAARARRWAIVMGAAGDAAEVLGQAPSFRAAPELYKQFRTMQVLGRALAGVRVKYVLGDAVAARADIDITMKQAESGLNLADYLDKKDNAPAQGGN
jgi:regulator of protease activity HflC (stomatin/prohibitin superfamily)